MIKLSIIIPFYNCHKYTEELLSCLAPQVTDEVQTILVDDGSEIPFKSNYEWLTVIRQKNGGASKARNTGLNNAKGEYVAFIDSDDLISDNYISTIINKINTEHFDYCYMSWKGFGGWNVEVRLNNVSDEFPKYNLCCWNRIYKRSVIGKVRFNESKAIAEDAEFIHTVQTDGLKKSFIHDYMYFYRSDTPNSLTKRFNNGDLYMRRGVFNYKHITSDMTDVLEKVKEYNKFGEAIIMTDRNDIPELEKYAMVTTPFHVKGTELFGEYTNLFTKLDLPIKTQVCLWTGDVYALGGMESFAYYWCSVMKEYYDIVVLVKTINDKQLERLEKIVRVVRVKDNKKIICDTLLCSRMLDLPPENIQYKHKYQLIHCCKLQKRPWNANLDNELVIPVSEAVKNSYPEIGNHPTKIINNIMNLGEIKRPLRLISATRLTFEKGGQRMAQLAQMFHDADIPFIWTIFSNDRLSVNIEGIVYVNPTIDVVKYIQGNDYLVQLSDSEAWGYSLIESLSLGVPVICTDIPVLKEIGIKNNINAKILPLDMKDVDVMDIYNNIPKVQFEYDNTPLIEQWRELLGNTTPLHDYIYEDRKTVVATRPYNDLQLKRNVRKGETLKVTPARARQLIEANVVKEA